MARDQKYRSLGDGPRLFVFVPQRQNYTAKVYLMLRTPRGAAVFADVRTLLRELNPYLPVLYAQSLRDLAAVGLLPQRLAGWLSGALGIVGMLMVAIGIYGVTAFSVGQRTREIGVRMALGAGRQDVLRMIVRQGLRLVGAGVAIGLAVALGVTRLLSALLFGLSAQDPLTYGGVTGMLICVAVLAAYIPARRASRVDPMTALRTD